MSGWNQSLEQELAALRDSISRSQARATELAQQRSTGFARIAHIISQTPRAQGDNGVCEHLIRNADALVTFLQPFCKEQKA